MCPAALSQNNLAALERQVDSVLSTGPSIVAVDVSNIDAAESAALEWLCALQNRIITNNAKMVLRKPSPVMRDILIATRLDHKFQIETATGGGE
jgi:anti-anti-sigma regulatory factor